MADEDELDEVTDDEGDDADVEPAFMRLVDGFREDRRGEVVARDPDTLTRLRHGLGDYPGLQSMPLLAPVLLPVCSPALLASGPALDEPVDCLQYPLLQDADRADWTLWLQAHGFEPDSRSRRGPPSRGRARAPRSRSRSSPGKLWPRPRGSR